MNQNETLALAQEIMLDFARLTGLEPVSDSPRRYLWTDAFAVCNYLELYRRMNDKKYLDLALRLVDQVHHTLGCHRDDDPRRGWISGLDKQEGERHPTAWGLRIGKKLNERKVGEPCDERLEWDQDGQYYHYLTKWMHALNRVGKVTRDPTYIRWAAELAKAANARFTYSTRPWGDGGRGQKRMYWKMSIDLTRPLVPSMGQHDPLDGFITYSELQATAIGFFKDSELPDLKREITDMAEICRGMSLPTDDPLGIGGLLFDASRTAQLMVQAGSKYESLLEAILKASLLGMDAFAMGGSMEYPAEYRLAFRELGLAIGLFGVENLRKWIEENPDLFRQESLRRHIEVLRGYVPIGEEIKQFWIDGKNRETASWTPHREINMVMLCTSIAPGEFLMI